MKIASLDKLLEDQLKDIYSAENQLVKALPKMAKGAMSPVLKQAITGHLEETKNQVKRLEEIGKLLSIKLTGKKCAAMAGLVEEGSEILEVEGPEAIVDLAIIAAAQRVEHYEISAYGSALALAEHLGQENVVKLLQETLDEESATDEKLTGIATDEIFPNVASGEEESDEATDAMEEAGEEDASDAPAPKLQHQKAASPKSSRKS